MNHLISALRYSLQGLKTAFRQQPAFRQEVGLLIIAIPLAFWLTPAVTERILLIGTIVLILIIELINSSIEAIVNRISKTAHPLSKEAKDLGSAAVFIAFLLAGITWELVWSAQSF